MGGAGDGGNGYPCGINEHIRGRCSNNNGKGNNNYDVERDCGSQVVVAVVAVLRVVVISIAKVRAMGLCGALAIVVVWSMSLCGNTQD